MWGGISLWFWCAFSWWLAMLRIISCVSWPSICLLWKKGPFRPSAHFKIKLLLCFMSSLYILYINPLLEICMQVKKQQNWTWKNRLVPNWERSTSRLYIVLFSLYAEYIMRINNPAYLTYMQSTSWETLGWMKHKLESRLLGEISTTSDMQMTPLLWQKANKN